MSQYDWSQLKPRLARFGFWTAFAGLLLLALLVRLERLGEADLWLDEAFTWERATLQPSAWDTATCVTTHPPLSRLTVRASATLFGDAPEALRLVPLLASLACLPLLAALLWHAGLGRLTILVALSLLALNPVAVDLATWVRHYSLAMALALWLTLVYLSLMRRPRLLTVVHYGAVLALGMYTYYLFFLVPVAHGLAALLWQPCSTSNAAGSQTAEPAEPPPAPPRVPHAYKVRLGALLAAGGVAFVLFLPWLVHLLSRWPGAEIAGYSGAEHASSFAGMTHWLLTSLLGVRYREQGMMDWSTMLPAAYTGYYLAVVALPWLGGAVLAWHWRSAGAAVVAWLGLALPWLFLGTLGAWINMFDTFWHFSFVLPFVLAVLAVGIAHGLRLGEYALRPRNTEQGASMPRRLAAGLACVGAGVVFVALLTSATYGLSAQHGWGLLPERAPDAPSLGQDAQPMERGPWRRIAHEIRSGPPVSVRSEPPTARPRANTQGTNETGPASHPRFAAVVAFPDYLEAALRYEIRELPVKPLRRGGEASVNALMTETQALIVEEPQGPRWPSLAEQRPASLWIVAPTWEREAPELAHLFAQLAEQGYEIEKHAEIIALYREVYLWRASRP